MEAQQIYGQMITIGKLFICDDGDMLHVEIDNINEPLMCFIYL
jgi:hypothetical protein